MSANYLAKSADKASSRLSLATPYYTTFPLSSRPSNTITSFFPSSFHIERYNRSRIFIPRHDLSPPKRITAASVIPCLLRRQCRRGRLSRSRRRSRRCLVVNHPSLLFLWLRWLLSSRLKHPNTLSSLGHTATVRTTSRRALVHGRTRCVGIVDWWRGHGVHAVVLPVVVVVVGGPGVWRIRAVVGPVEWLRVLVVWVDAHKFCARDQPLFGGVSISRYVMVVSICRFISEKSARYALGEKM